MLTKREKKREIITDLKDSFQRQKIVFLIGYKGLAVGQINELREDLGKIEASFQVAKKTLIKIAFKNFEKEKFQDQVAIIFGYKDEISPAKTVYAFYKKNDNLKILGGYLENVFISEKEIIGLANMETREKLLEKLVFVMKSPIHKFINTLKGNPKKLVFALNGIKIKKSSGF